MFIAFSIILGALVGSFLNVCIFRLPQGQSIITPGSHCPHCKRPVRFYDNLPLISYLILQGRCRNCGAAISLQYPIIEAMMALLSLLLFLRFKLSLSYFIYFSFVAALTVITIIDLYHQIIPDSISLPGIGVGFLVSWFTPHQTPFNSLMGILVGGGSLFLVATLYEWLFKREGMGGGDIKLLAMIGAFLGWKAVISTILISSFIGSIVGIAMMVRKRAGMKYAIPFGPFLSLGAVISLFFGPRLMNWYLGLHP